MRRVRETGWQRMLGVGLAVALVAGLASTAGAQSVLRIVPQADLKILDTVWTTNNITSNHGYMIYDVLFAPNAKLEYKPQMVDTLLEERGRARLAVQAPGRPPVQRREPGPGQGCRGLAQALGRPRPGGQDAPPVRQGRGGHRAAHVRDPAGQALRPGPGGPGDAGEPALHPPGEGSPDPVRQADHRDHRLRPLRDGQGRVGAGQQGGLQEEPALQAAVGRAGRVRRGQARQGGPGRVGGDPRRQHGHPGPHQGRGGHHRDPDHGPPPAHEEGGQHHRQGDRSGGNPGGPAPEPPEPAVQQRQEPAGPPLRGGRPEGLPGRHHRQPRVREVLLADLHVRHAPRDRRGHRRLGHQLPREEHRDGASSSSRRAATRARRSSSWIPPTRPSPMPRRW